MNKLLVQTIVTSTLLMMCMLMASAQSSASRQEPAPQRQPVFRLGETLNLCLYELRLLDEGFDSFSPEAWSKVPNHLFHCQMLIRAEVMLGRYRSPASGGSRLPARNGPTMDET